MGDRVIFVLHNSSGGAAASKETQAVDISPSIYAHWAGHEAPEILVALRNRMEGRPNDVPYAAARLVGILHERIPGNLSLGIWDGPTSLAEATSKEYSHGDAGVILVDVANWQAEAWHGYGFFEVNDYPEHRQSDRPVARVQITESQLVLLRPTDLADAAREQD